MNGRSRTLLVDSIEKALLTNVPINFYAPRCLRYYYDNTGDQQIIGSTESHDYIDKNGELVCKSREELIAKFLSELQTGIDLKRIGVPTKITVPVMDHEILRPAVMYTASNISKIENYILDLIELADQIALKYGVEIDIQSSLEYFGNPRKSKIFQQLITTITTTQVNQYGISEQALQYHIDSTFRKNNSDNSRSDFYRSRDFSKLITISDIAEIYYHANIINQRTNTSGNVVIIPKGSELLKLGLNAVKNICYLNRK